MTHDTSKDPRLLVARRACALLKKAIHQKMGVRLPVGRERLDQWTATVSGIDGCIGLQEVVAIGDTDATMLRADDACGNRTLQSKRLSQRQDPVSNLHSITVA